MDKVNQLLKTQEELDRLQKELARLKRSKPVQKELAFQNELQALLKKHGKTTADLAKLLRAGGLKTEAASKRAPARKQRKLKVYLNPHTGEKIETRGGNHKGLKAWKEQYGAEEVERWLQQ